MYQNINVSQMQVNSIHPQHAIQQNVHQINTQSIGVINGEQAQQSSDHSHNGQSRQSNGGIEVVEWKHEQNEAIEPEQKSGSSSISLSQVMMGQQAGAANQGNGQLTIDNLWKILASEKPADAKPVAPNQAPANSRKEFGQAESNLFGAQANADKQSVAETQASGGLLPPFSIGMSNKKFNDQLVASPACPTTAAKTEFRTPMSDANLFATPNGQKTHQYNGQGYMVNQSQHYYTPAMNASQSRVNGAGDSMAFSTPAKDGQEFRNGMEANNMHQYGYSMAENCNQEDQLQSREQGFNFAAKSTQD